MALVCDMCNKGARTRGPGKDLFRVQFVFANDINEGSFSVTFARVGSLEERYYSKSNAPCICGACLQKAGIYKMLEEEIKNRLSEERKKTKEVKALPQGQFLLEE